MNSLVLLAALTMPAQCSGGSCGFHPARAVGRVVAAPFKATGRALFGVGAGSHKQRAFTAQYRASAYYHTRAESYRYAAAPGWIPPIYGTPQCADGSCAR